MTAFVGAALAIVLALGTANPPRAANLVLNLHSADDLAPAGTFEDMALFALPVELTPPFTIEMQASASGNAASAWGLWLRARDVNSDERVLPMLIDNRGYALAALTRPALQHVQFMHIRSGSNRVSVHVDSDAHATYRVNDEIFATLSIFGVQAGGLATRGTSNLSWDSIKVYTGR